MVAFTTARISTVALVGGTHKHGSARSHALRSSVAVPLTHQPKRVVLQCRRSVRVRAEQQSSQPLKTRDGRTVYISDSDDYMPDQAELCVKIKEHQAELLKLGEKQSMINTCVAGTYNDTKQLLLYQQVLKEELTEEVDANTLYKLQQMDELMGQMLTIRKGDTVSIDEVSSVLTDNLDIPEEEKRGLTSAIGSAAAGAIDTALWSSITLVLLALSLFNFIRPGN